MECNNCYNFQTRLNNFACACSYVWYPSDIGFHMSMPAKNSLLITYTLPSDNFAIFIMTHLMIIKLPTGLIVSMTGCNAMMNTTVSDTSNAIIPRITKNLLSFCSSFRSFSKMSIVYIPKLAITTNAPITAKNKPKPITNNPATKLFISYTPILISLIY